MQQPINSVALQGRRHRFDVPNTNSIDLGVLTSNQFLTACLNEGEETSVTTNRMEERLLDINADLIKETNNDDNKIEEQPSLSISAKAEPYSDSSGKDLNPRKQETSSSGRAAMSKKQTRCRGVGKIQITF